MSEKLEESTHPLSQVDSSMTGEDPSANTSPTTGRRFVLLGNPNTGKTTLFNRLTGLRHKTTNFPGSTQEARIGQVRIGGGKSVLTPQPGCCDTASDDDAPATTPPGQVELIDLPGVYSLKLDQSEAHICTAALAGSPTLGKPEAICIVLNADNLARGLALVAEAMEYELPIVVALNMIDLAAKRGLRIDASALAKLLDCPVVSCNARSGAGFDELRLALSDARKPSLPIPKDADAIERWANDLYAQVVTGTPTDSEARTDKIDRLLTHPLFGLVVFVTIMAGLFWMLFRFATYPMNWINTGIGQTSQLLLQVTPDGLIRELLVGGIIPGIGVVLVFLPQIALLFFILSLLEDSGYLSRAAFIMDRLLHPFGLSGRAFVPMLSAHACALPALIAARGIPDRRERLATILTAPFMTCSARLPVYMLIITMFFHDRPALAAITFVGCYALGIAAALLSALLARRTLLRGASRPMVMELPHYQWPSLSNALLVAYDRSIIFLRMAGTIILAISIVLWWMGRFPQTPPPAEAIQLRAQAALIVQDAGAADYGPNEAVEDLLAQATRLETSHAKANSYAGQLGHFLQPVFAPLGFDWRLTMGVVTSFAAREVFVSTMAVVTSGQSDVTKVSVLQAIADGRRDDGRTPIFTTATTWSLLVYYVLAMQCLPTLVLTARESGSWRWAALQFFWMTGLAYTLSLLVHMTLISLGYS